MAISTYTELQAAVAAWMHRTDLAGRIPDFIALAETRIKAMLRLRLQNMEGVINTTLGVDSAPVPIGLIKVRSLSIPDVRPEITYVTPGQYFSAFNDDRSGQPYNYTIIGGLIYFGPPPDAAYSANVVYEAEVTPLSNDDPTNIVLSKWPNVYLWGALKEAANFARNVEYEGICEGNFMAAIDAANKMEWHSGGPMRMHVDTYTP